MAIDLHWLPVGLPPLALLLILLIGTRRFLQQTWLFFTFPSFAELLIDVVVWHVEHGIAFDRHDLNLLIDRLVRAQDIKFEIRLVRQHYHLHSGDEEEPC